MESEGRGCLAEPEIRHAALSVHHPVGGVDLEDAGEPLGGDHDAASRRHRAAAKARPSATRRVRNRLLDAPPHEPGDFLGRLRQHDGIRRVTVDGIGVRIVGSSCGRVGDDPLLGENGFEFTPDLARRRHARSRFTSTSNSFSRSN